MVIASPRTSARPMLPVPDDLADIKEWQRIITRAIRQLQERAKHVAVELPAVQTANYTMTDNDNLILMDATSGALTVTLLTAAGRHMQPVTVKKLDASSNLVTVVPAGSETLDNSATVGLSQKNSARTWISDGTNWQLVSGIGNANAL